MVGAASAGVGMAEGRLALALALKQLGMSLVLKVFSS